MSAAAVSGPSASAFGSSGVSGGGSGGPRLRVEPEHTFFRNLTEFLNGCLTVLQAIVERITLIVRAIIDAFSSSSERQNGAGSVASSESLETRALMQHTLANEMATWWVTCNAELRLFIRESRDNTVKIRTAIKIDTTDSATPSFYSPATCELQDADGYGIDRYVKGLITDEGKKAADFINSHNVSKINTIFCVTMKRTGGTSDIIICDRERVGDSVSGESHEYKGVEDADLPEIYSAYPMLANLVG